MEESGRPIFLPQSERSFARCVFHHCRKDEFIGVNNSQESSRVSMKRVAAKGVRVQRNGRQQYGSEVSLSVLSPMKKDCVMGDGNR